MPLQLWGPQKIYIKLISIDKILLMYIFKIKKLFQSQESLDFILD